MSYKGAYMTLADAEKGGKAISFVPSSDGRVYRISDEEFGVLTTPALSANLFDTIKPGFKRKLPKIPASIFSQIISFFSVYSSKDIGYEAMVQIYWDKVERRFIVSVPKQKCSKLNIDADIEIFDIDRYILYMDIHSHNTMGANFSNKDDRDERATMLYAVVGRLHEKTPEIKVRASNGGYFLSIDPEDVFELCWDKCSYPSEWDSKVTQMEMKLKQLTPKTFQNQKLQKNYFYFLLRRMNKNEKT